MNSIRFSFKVHKVPCRVDIGGFVIAESCRTELQGQVGTCASEGLCTSVICVCVLGGGGKDSRLKTLQIMREMREIR